MKDMRSPLVLAPFALVFVAACASGPGDFGGDDATEVGMSTGSADQALKGCHGKASYVTPASGTFYLTSFGNSSGDDGIMSCGTYTKHGSWWYAASRQRFGCGAHIKVEANGKCVVVKTDDYGPDVCVETAAGGAILDASPLVVKALFGDSSAGWSDHYKVKVTKVSVSTPLGPCS